MTIDFDTNDHYSYNDVFTLKQVIKISRDTSLGIDTVHYQLLKILPEDSLLLFLYILNHIWVTANIHILSTKRHNVTTLQHRRHRHTHCKHIVVVVYPRP